mmetsp:Transcript_5885/g.11138  ORF Transcript_5885/g.11138 Transcript_5885/m.11138 type:complete len:412 (+) Transcript_5885:39-1274(+)
MSEDEKERIPLVEKFARSYSSDVERDEDIEDDYEPTCWDYTKYRLFGLFWVLLASFFIAYYTSNHFHESCRSKMISFEPGESEYGCERLALLACSFSWVIISSVIFCMSWGLAAKRSLAIKLRKIKRESKEFQELADKNNKGNRTYKEENRRLQARLSALRKQRNTLVDAKSKLGDASADSKAMKDKLIQLLEKGIANLQERTQYAKKHRRLEAKEFDETQKFQIEDWVAKGRAFFDHFCDKNGTLDRTTFPALRMAMQKSIPGLKCISMQYTDFATYNEKLAKYTFVDKIRGLTKNYGQEQKEALLKSHAVENHKDESILNELNRMLKQAKDEGMSMYEYITGAASATPIENLETLALKVKNMSPSMVMEGISNYGAQSEPLRLRRRTEVVVKQRDPAVDASNVSIRKLK